MKKTLPIASLAALLLASSITMPALADGEQDIVIGVNGQPAKLDPADAPLAVDMRVTYSIFDTLIRRNFVAENDANSIVLEPGLAESWERVDERTLELRLREGVLFHNGDTLTAQDVAFTFSEERIFGEDAMIPTGRRYLGDIQEVEIVDDLTVRIRTAAADPVLELRLADSTAGIVNMRSYMEQGVDGFKRNPVGTGPAQFVSWQDGDQLEFAAFEDYWAGTPAFSTLTYRVIPDASARIACLINQECDLIVQVSADQLDTINSYDYLRTEENVIENFQVLWFVGTSPELSDPLIRQALSLSIDRELLVEALWGGKTTVPNSWQVPTFGSLFDADRQDFRYAPDEARALLEEAGYDGQELTIRNVAGYYPAGDEMIQAVQRMWQDVGLNVNLEMVEGWPQVYEPGRSIGTGSMTFLMPAPEGIGWAFFGREAIAVARHGFSPSEEFFELAEDLFTTGDADARREIYGDVLDYMATNVPGTAVYMMPQFYGVSSDLNWSSTSSYLMDFRPDVLISQTN